jgi:hypothetical protein
LQTIINFSTSFFLHLSFRFSTPSLSLSIFSPLRHVHSSITLPTVSVCVWLCGNYKMRDEMIKCEPSDYIFILNTYTTWYSFLFHRLFIFVSSNSSTRQGGVNEKCVGITFLILKWTNIIRDDKACGPTRQKPIQIWGTADQLRHPSLKLIKPTWFTYELVGRPVK